MSRIGGKNIFVASNVRLFKFENFILILGLFGNFRFRFNFPVKILKKNRLVELYPLKKYKQEKQLNAAWGTLRSHFFNCTYGASNNFNIFFRLIGVGFKMFKKHEKIILRLGLSHQIFLEVPFKKINIKKVQKRPLTFLFSSSDYDLLQNISFFIRQFKKPDIYKGKGFNFERELIKLKQGKELKN